MRSIPDLAQVIRDRGGKLTPQRLLIYTVLEGSQSHPSAEAVYDLVHEVMPTVSLTTVYKTLNELVSMGEVKRFDVQGVAHFDPNTNPHAEAVCLSCKRVVDVSGPAPYNFEDIDGFQITSAALTFYGYCSECRKDLAQEPSSRSERVDG